MNGVAHVFTGVVGFAVATIKRLRDERDELQNLLALDRVTLRDIGLDRPRAISLPVSR